MDERLLKRAIRHHGRLLLSFLESNPDFASQKTGNLIPSPCKESPHPRSTLSLKQFVAQKASLLFTEDPKKETSSSSPPPAAAASSALKVDKCPPPPLESFAPISAQDRTRHFLKSVQIHDILCCRLRSSKRSTLTTTSDGLHLYVDSFGPPSTKSRAIQDLFIKAYCPHQEIPPGFSLLSGKPTQQLLLVYVTEIHPDSSLLVSMSPPPGPLFTGIQFGALPTPVDQSKATQPRQSSLQFALKEDLSSFIKPSLVETLAHELGLSPNQSSSLCSTFIHDYPPKELAPALRSSQAHTWAFKSVESGIRYIKSGDNVEAFQCLNTAINIDPVNVEGLVARGALFANTGSYTRAIGDFERALKEEPEHKNAQKYIIETLLALGKEQEIKKKDGSPLETYKKVLVYDPNHFLARQSIALLAEAASNKRTEYDRAVDSFIERTRRPPSSSKKSPPPRRESSSRSPSPLSNSLLSSNRLNGRNGGDGARTAEEEDTLNPLASYLDHTTKRNTISPEDKSRRNRSSSRHSPSRRRDSSGSAKKKKKSRKRSLSSSKDRRRSSRKYREEEEESRKKHRRKSHGLSSKSLEKDLKGIQAETNRIEKERQDINARRIRSLSTSSAASYRDLCPSSIIPGQSNLDDVVAFVEQKRRDKMEQLKKNLSSLS